MGTYREQVSDDAVGKNHLHPYIIYILYRHTLDNLLILFEMFDSLVIWAFAFPSSFRRFLTETALRAARTESEAHRVAKEKNPKV